MSTGCLATSFVVVTVIAGSLGGLINYYQSYDPKDAVKGRVYYFLLGIGAAFIVPLFLSLAKSAILTNVFSSPIKLDDWFVYFGAAVLVAIYAKKFLETISEKFLQLAQQAKNAADNAARTANQASGTATEALNKVEAAGESSINQTDDATKKARFAAVVPAFDFSGYSPDEQKVLKALMNSKYPLGRRTLGGIAVETKLSREAASDILNKLVTAGVVQEKSGEATGNDYYELRPRAPATT